MLSPTPFDGTSRPFTIGLKPLDPAAWIETDGDLAPMLAEKDRLNAAIPAEVFVEEPDTRAAQAEVRDLLVGHLLAACPDRYAMAGRHLLVDGVPRADLDDTGRPPLLAAASLVADDLVLMRRSDAGWRLVAASLCFPSSWTLSEKFGRSLQVIHNPVPGFGEGTRTADVIQRIFDNIKGGQSLVRWNWSLQGDATLYKPLSNDQRDTRATASTRRFPGGLVRTFIRVERQTLTALPASGDILFTIRIYLDPLQTLARHPDRVPLARSLATQLEGLDAAQLGYKGLAADRDTLVAQLRTMADAG